MQSALAQRRPTLAPMPLRDTTLLLLVAHPGEESTGCGGLTARCCARGRLLGRHARRPAHFHFFVSAPGFRRLTTQINIDGDACLHDDFAFATRDGLIPPMRREPGAAHGVDGEAVAITFDFALTRDRPGLPAAEVVRAHAMAD